ncbi:helix-turn-helix domain-containing protein [Simiduia agarivorans]|uniref:AraC family transcriptional regulator n=1 Tax=Simiduia agarivorans (strain DSM 21679 / JCM 13881 / BCRC 17597 / SA1) TaxID=1117647 RepID=K4KR91_SIMAS|nr:AraC family transcriptional regulator [Simiduia agarivorans]AFV00791.1 AraC family transcriptional regulator [Simiduia agarivorans SA1 = DSM 21679]
MKEHLFNLHDVFLFISMAVCLLLSLFQWLLIENGRERSLLAAFLLSLALSSFSVLLLWNTEIHPPAWLADGLLPYLLTLSLLAHGPLLYLYIRSLTQKTVPVSLRDAWHLLPLLLVWIPMLAYGVDASAMRLEAESDTFWLGTLLWDFVKIQPVFYAGWCLWRVMRYQRALQQEYSHYSRRELVWLFLLAGGFMANWVWTLVVHWIAKYASIALADQLGIVDNYVTFILLNALFIYSLVYAQSMLVTQPESTNKAPAEDEDLDEQAVQKVRQAMEQDQLYLEQNVNIEGFASRINLPVRTVSNVINKHFNSNFFEFINGYRVEAAKQMLADPACDNQTILDILLAAGFNSKSAFHRFFSRLVGMSPSEFRKQSRQQA